MNDDPVQGVITTIDTANKHRLHLAELLAALEAAKEQVKKSSSESKEKVRSHMEVLRAALNKALDEREKELMTAIECIENDALEPLVECEEMIMKGVEASADILAKGKELLAGDHDANVANMIAYKNLVNDPKLQSLPEVPSLSEVACISIDLPDNTESNIASILKDHGRVLGRAPVQITDIEARPGSLVVHWSEIEEENALDLSEFRLQYCPSSAGTESSYKDIYQGAATNFILRHARVGSTYYFRVCGRADGADIWSPWSVPTSAMTAVDHYEWSTGVNGYTTSNENKMASRDLDVSPLQVLYSSQPAYTCGQSMIFKVLESGDIQPDDGIGITIANQNKETLMHHGSLFISAEGAVYMDCCEKTTRLPALTRGAILTFETEVLQPGKVRVNIEVNEKVVTFDWHVEKVPVKQESAQSLLGGFGFATSQSNESDINLYFAMKFSSQGWKVGVE